MSLRLSLALIVAAAISATVAVADAQVVRFQTTAGDFDMVLNPTDNPLLQEHVDNMLAYVENNSYKGSWINRAAESFVLQMGGFYSHTRRVPLNIDSTRSVVDFASPTGVPAAETGTLSNTLGTVSLALPGDGMGGTNQDAGTSSFFVNLTDNSFLDTDFTVFAAISDMTTINKIMAMSQVDLTALPDFGAGSGNLGFSDVPLDENNYQVFIRNAFVINDTLAVAQAKSKVQSIMAASIAGGGNGGASLTAPLMASVVPEPASFVLVLGGMLAAALPRRRRR